MTIDISKCLKNFLYFFITAEKKAFAVLIKEKGNAALMV